MTLALTPAEVHPELLGYPAAARFLGNISLRSVRREVDAKRLRAVRIRSRVFFELAELQDYIRRQRTCPSASVGRSGTSTSRFQADRELDLLLAEVRRGNRRSSSRLSTAATSTPAASGERRIVPFRKRSSAG